MTKDPKVEAMRNRATRIVGTGVPYGEFEELIDGIDRWEDWCAAWSARAAIHEEIGREALASGHGLSAGHHLNTAALIYHFGKFTFINDMAQLRAAHQKAVECMTLALPHFLPPGAHIQIPYEGKFLAANLRRPEGQAPAPVVILVSGLDAAKEELHDTEQFFLERGMATLSVDGPGQGEAEYDFPLRYDFEVPMGAAIDWVETRSDLDRARIGLLGSSLGGYFAARTVAFEKRIKACICNSISYEIYESFDQRPPGLKELYCVRFHCGAVDEVKERVKAFDIADWVPNITCPMFVIGSREDRVRSYKDAERLAAEVSGPAELLIVEGAIHVAANRPYHHQTQTADWMAQELGLEKM